MPWNSYFLIAIIFTLIVVVIGVGLRIQTVQAKYRTKNGLECLLFLKMFLMLVQQHRGTTTGYLSGDASLKGNVEGIEYKLRDLLRSDNTFSVLSSDARWIGIKDHWSRLSGNYTALGKKDNLQQHNTMISHLLYLIEDIADHYRLIDLQADVKLAALWKEALTAAEYIGQARAIGTGVAAAKECDSVSRIRLLYLHDKIISSLNSGGSSVAGGQNEQLAIADFTTELKKLTSEQPLRVTSNEYYQLATNALDGIYTQFDKQINMLISRI